MYGRVLIEKKIVITEGYLEELQCEFKNFRDCVGLMFAMRQLSKNYVGKERSLYAACMDLEKVVEIISLK